MNGGLRIQANNSVENDGSVANDEGNDEKGNDENDNSVLYDYTESNDDA